MLSGAGLYKDQMRFFYKYLRSPNKKQYLATSVVFVKLFLGDTSVVVKDGKFCQITGQRLNHLISVSSVSLYFLYGTFSSILY